jgi:putative salt-induced outer membrane protein
MIRTTLTVAAAAVALATPLAARSQDKPDGQWHGNASVGGTLSSGNNDSLTLSLNASTSRATTEDKVSLYSVGNYGRSKVSGVKTTTADLLRLGGRYDFNLSQDWFSFGAAEGETDKAGAGVRDRYSLNGGVGYHVLHNDQHTVDLFAGAGYTDTRLIDGTSDKGAQALLGEESKHKLSDTTTLNQRLTYYPKSGDLGTRVNFDAGLATQIAGSWTLNTGLSSRYNREVPAGLKKTENLLTVGFGYKF